MDRKNIFLGGFMASGKTSVGLALAKRTRKPFLDTDRVIEARTGKSVAEIFRNSGEKAFRKMEKDVVHEISEMKGTIVALGGGILDDPDLKGTILRSGILVILSVLPETAVKRASEEKGKRPLMNKGGIHALWERRRPSYSGGHLEIDTEVTTVEEETGLIIKHLGLEDKDGVPGEVTITARAGSITYPVVIGSGILGSVTGRIRSEESCPVVVSDMITGPLFADRIKPSRRMNMLPRGEHAKSWIQLEGIFRQLQESNADRSSCMLALGGGTVGDVTGFAAASWMRGVNFIQCPTTLLAQVDSALGGKTGINMPGGKNLVGAFHQPLAVFSDVDCIDSLSDVEYRQGLGEIVKYGLGQDRDLFTWLKLHAGPILSRDKETMIRMIEWCSRIKLDVVERDETERNGLRAQLNLGHTIGHALEAASGYSGWKHGDAVAVGMMVVALLSVSMGEMTISQFEELHNILKTFGLPVRSEIPWSAMEPYLRKDKKFSGGNPRVVIPMGIGESILTDTVELKDLGNAYREVMFYEEKTGLSCG